MTIPTPTIVAGIDVGKSGLDAYLEPGGQVLFFSLFQWILPNYSMNSSGRCSNWFTTAGENWGRVKAL